MYSKKHRKKTRREDCYQNQRRKNLKKVEWPIVSRAMQRSGSIRFKTSLPDLVVENRFKGMTETEIS